jgi:hypothetical protein
MISKVEYPNVILLSFPNRRELTLTMCRPQEFYESDRSEIRGKYFDWEKFIESFSDESGRIEYFSFWSGFNFPGTAFEKFLEAFEGNLSSREGRLALEVFSKVDRSRPYYVIATLPNAADTIRHEMAHALFCVNQEYRKKVESLLASVSEDVLFKMESGLERMGYSSTVHPDEIQAYLSTASSAELKSRFNLAHPEIESSRPPFRETLEGFLPTRA